MECLKPRVGSHYLFHPGTCIATPVIHEEIELHGSGFTFNLDFLDIREPFAESGWWSGVTVRYGDIFSSFTIDSVPLFAN